VSTKKNIDQRASKIPGVSFSTLPDPAGDSATFLICFYLIPKRAKRTVDEFNKARSAGFNYWFLICITSSTSGITSKKLKAAANFPSMCWVLHKIIKIFICQKIAGSGRPLISSHPLHMGRMKEVKELAKKMVVVSKGVAVAHALN